MSYQLLLLSFGRIANPVSVLRFCFLMSSYLEKKKKKKKDELNKRNGLMR